ncbi:MAG: UDP-N-acetylmuramate dehydrogenase [Corynebacterium sp.]|uniref:UDP-N-acetylmuramate dehydrogenase n=1 Tax=Corynebacterium sp. TaxID=1720 RepID=UPI0026DBA663|nr:UDP-N-acetylmuramate dehydrogenase [Corynebacterium sp.]MDO4761082.1 UDP-N-acetylmuramate dehydrogenase [Corynebacterium sp.]
MPLDTLDALVRSNFTSLDGVTIDHTSFAQLTTLHLGGTPAATIRCATTRAVVDVVTLLDAHNIPLIIVGGGSNLVVADGELPVVAVVLECDAIAIDTTTGLVEVEAGAVWDHVVDLCVEQGLGGLECLSGIPGSAGATPVQNVGAYGVEISDLLTEVELYHRDSGKREWVAAADLELAYRYSNLKFTARAVVLAIRLQLYTDGLSAPIRFGELARSLNLPQSEAEARTNPRTVREAVLQLRGMKGMVYDENDHDTWSAGSFFTNPIVSAEQAETVRALVRTTFDDDTARRMPCFDVGDQRKLSAAWLIDRAGFSKGYPHEGAARLSTKHTLALTNRGNATTQDLVTLAQEIRDGVEQKFGVRLHPEPVWIGVSID